MFCLLIVLLKPVFTLSLTIKEKYSHYQTCNAKCQAYPNAVCTNGLISFSKVCRACHVGVWVDALPCPCILID